MRRGRFIIGAAVLCVVAGFAGAPAALADGGTPQDICNDLKDGVVNGSYSAAEWTAFFSDPTIQGYGCGGAITPPTTPPVTPPVTPPTGTPPSTPPTGTPPSTPPSTPPATPSTPSTPATPTPVTPATPAVPLTPTPATTGVKGAQATVVSKPKPAATPTTGVQGANHTVRTPATKSAAAPLAATKSSGTLPFTGAQLSLFLLVGLALVATGLLLRSTGRPNQKP